MSNINDTIGCVNHDCAKCRAAQPAPVQKPLFAEIIAQHPGLAEELKALNEGFDLGFKAGLAAAQPAPVQEPDYWLGFGLQAHTEKPFENATPLYTTPPAAQPALPPMHASGLVAIKTLLNRDPCAHAKVAIEMIDEMLAAAPQPVPVKTYHDGKPWPAAPKPWVGLTDEEKASLANSVDYDEYYLLVENVEAKLKELNT